MKSTWACCGRLGSGQSRLDVIGRELDRERSTGVGLQIDPVTVGPHDRPAGEFGVERRRRVGVGAVEDDVSEAHRHRYLRVSQIRSGCGESSATTGMALARAVLDIASHRQNCRTGTPTARRCGTGTAARSSSRAKA